MTVEQARARAEVVRRFSQHTESEIALVTLADEVTRLERYLVSLDNEMEELQKAAAK